MLSPTDQAVFEKSCLVYGFKPDFIKEVQALGTSVLFRGGDEIVKHKGKDQDIYVILDGRVNILTHDGDKLSEAGPGLVIGEVSFLDAGSRHYTAVAIAHVTTLKFQSMALRKKMCEDKELGFWLLANLSRLLCSRLRDAEEHLDALMDTAHEAWNTWDR